jgi:Flp pilus assembly protein TadD
LLAFLAYANTLGHGFVWDDPISVQRWLPALQSLSAIFFPPSNIPQFPPDYYRPLQLLSYQLDRFLGDGAAWPFHLTVVLLHAVATFLVFRCGLRLFADAPAGNWAAFWSAALFAVHPIHSESVAWMAARPDVMVACFGLAAVLVQGRLGWSPWKRSSIAALLVLLALFSKENAAALLLLVPASAMFALVPGSEAAARRHASPVGKALPWAVLSAPFLVVAGLYLLMRAVALSGMPSTPMALPENPLAAWIAAVGAYLRLLLFPYPQSAYISELPLHWTGLAMGVVLITGLSVAVWYAWTKRQRPLLFGLLWMSLTLAPSLVVVLKLPTAPIAERYLYMPSIGFCWGLGWLIVQGLKVRRVPSIAVHAGLAVLAVAALARTVTRNQVWRDNYSLWSDTAARNQVDGLPLRSLAAAHLERGDAPGAERLFQAALQLRNDTLGKYVIYNNLGSIALNRKDLVAAERYYERARAQQTTPDCLYNLALIALHRGTDDQLTPEAGVRAQHLQTARRLFDEALAASPFDPEIHVGLGQTAQALGDNAAARRHFQRALDLGMPPQLETAVRKLLKATE